MSSLQQALHDAGYQTSEGLLREIAMQALYAHPRDPYARRRAIMARIGEDANLLRTLFERYVADATDRLIAAVRNDMLVNQRTGRGGMETRGGLARAQPLASGGQPRGEAQLHRVPADQADAGDHIAAESRTTAVPGAGAQAVAAAARLSLLDTFRVNGQPLGDVTPAEARLWAEARGRQARRDGRFIELITAGLPDGLPIRRCRRADEAEAAWAQALTEAV